VGGEPPVVAALLPRKTPVLTGYEPEAGGPLRSQWM